LLFHIPILSKPDFGLIRAPGPGLGNILFPISRAVVGKEIRGGSVILPTMRQLKVGTFIRREKDKRTYGDIIRPRTAKEWLDWWHVQTLSKDNEYDLKKLHNVTSYEGLGNQFHDIQNYRNEIIQYIKSISNLSLEDSNKPYDIAVHIRLGDFQSDDSNNQYQNTRIALDWYKLAIKSAKEKIGKKRCSGVLFSDEDPDFLIKKLGLLNFTPEPRGNALQSIFKMSNSDILVGSRSTFSLWAQFIGNSYTIWPKDFELNKYKIVNENYDYFI